jgi:uncharacterized Zn-binding protein involved in type VI secretion
MPAVQRKGDQDDAGGAILDGIDSVLVNGLPIAVLGAQITSHDTYEGEHLNATTRNSQSSVTAEGRFVIVTNDIDTCGHQRQGGSPNVNIG